MKSRLPNREEIEELVFFLPLFSEEGFQPVRQWRGGEKNEKGYIQVPYPEYDDVVGDFYKAASKECWCDYSYVPADAAVMVENQGLIQTASLSQIKTLLTYCVRGERFGDGFWAAMIENGIITSILKRLCVLYGVK